MPLDAGTLGLLLLFGGWSALDGASFGQFMISRPLVSATVAGAIAGDPVAAAMVGLVLEAMQLPVLPVGAARYPESGPPAVAAGAVVAAAGPGPVILLTAVVFALAWEWVCGESVRYLRMANGRIAAAPIRPVAVAGDIERRHLVTMAVDFVRGVTLTAGGIVLLRLLVEQVVPLWTVDRAIAADVLAALAVAVLASTVRLFGDRTKLFAVGAACGLLYLLLW